MPAAAAPLPPEQRAALRLVPMVLLLALAACAGTPAPRAPAQGAATAPFPHAFYRSPPSPGRVFQLDPARSRLDLLMFRAGALAGRGHNHLIRAGTLEGAVFLGDAPEASRMDLHVPVAELLVDPPQARASAGAAFAGEVEDRARAGTRANLLGERVLDATAHPRIAVSATVAGGELPWLLLSLSVTVRGVTHTREVPVRLELDEDALRVRGLLALRHAELGLQPFTALGGLLAVADPVLVRFDLHAARTSAAD